MPSGTVRPDGKERWMDVDVLVSHKTIPDEVRERTVTKLRKLGKLAPLLEVAEVRLLEDQERPAVSRWACHAVLRGHGHEIFGHAEATDPLGAVDAVVAKLEHQVERLKGKLIGRSHPRHENPSLGA
jgi:ribosome-associated translation inhibitor RaiA